MHACDLTQTFISGYAAQAGQNNGQANKGNGIIYIHTCSIHIPITYFGTCLSFNANLYFRLRCTRRTK